jgi:hypothetical protein
MAAGPSNAGPDLILSPTVADYASSDPPTPLNPLLAPSSFTAHRLRHSTPGHMHLTSRAVFIGPVPKGWAQKKEDTRATEYWISRVRERAGLRERALTFSAEPSVGLGVRRVSGLALDDEGRGGGSGLRIHTGNDGHGAKAVVSSGSGAAGKQSSELSNGVERVRSLERSTITERSVEREATNLSDAGPRTPKSPDRSTRSPVIAREGRPRSRRDSNMSAKEGLRIISPAPEPSPGEEQELNIPDSTVQTEPADTNEPNLSTNLTVPPRNSRSRSPSPGASGTGADIGRQSSIKSSNSGNQRRLSTQDSNVVSAMTHSPLLSDADSTTRLIPDITKSPTIPSVLTAPQPAGASLQVPTSSEPLFTPTGIVNKVTRHRSKSSVSKAADAEASGAEMPSLKQHIRFDLTNQATRSALLMRAQLAQREIGRVGSRVKSLFHGGDVQQGEILKMEKMLVREDITSQKKLPDDFDENTSQGVVSSTIKKWREYMIVCRRSEKIEGARFVLQAYKTRAIPALEAKSQVKPEYEIPIEKKMMKFNLYSSLDKTLVFWFSDIQKTHIFILQSHSAANSVEWYTLLRGLMGYERPTELTISVPDINVSLHLDDPFQVLRLDEEADQEDEGALLDSLAKEEHVASSIIHRCVSMLEASNEWSDAIHEWNSSHRIGLAWKRYDRLEWVSGVNEQKMFGTIAMIQSHDLELRPKEHYPTKAVTAKGKTLVEPPPVEGFLILRTSQRGAHGEGRWRRGYSRRLYFGTFDHYLVFTRPRDAHPPQPPSKKPGDDGKVPIVYSVNPYQTTAGKVEWLNDANPIEVKARDQFAADEARRRFSLLNDAEGFIDLSEVIKVRKLKKKNLAENETVTIQIDAPVSDDEDEEDEVSNDQLSDDKTFELLLRNGLSVRLQAFDDSMRKEWRDRLRALVKYWRWRHRLDVQLYRQVRTENLDELQIDEEGEAWVGQFARKWELTQTYASPEIYNVCGLSFCRTIHLSGPLYRKPRMHGNFTLMHCILVPGSLLIFQSVLRKRTGKVVPHVHHAREQKMDLEGCYLYSGLLTENDLLYHNRTFDANSPGHHALPRIWPEDGWNNFDEDVMTCFVLWRPSGKSWFRDEDQEEGGGTKRRFKRVSALGKTGNRVVFRARSRAERDQWVLAIGAEIERLASGGKEEVRIVESK